MTTVAEAVTAGHRERHAYVYVRQSTPKQVQLHQESQHNQYALVGRAIALGWSPDRVHVINADLGHSGQDSQRPGFQELVTEVSLGRVGLVLAYEASRLARNYADGYRLLDRAALVGTLIADTEGVYDPRSYNDRLLLGLRGMLSEAELHLLRQRMEAGRRRKIERGTYRQHLLTGLVRLEDGRVVKDPDQQVQRTIELIFDRFATLGSCQKLMRSLRDDGILLPRRRTGGVTSGQLLWKKPSASALADLLHNPAYAGAFAYGRRRLRRDRYSGELRNRRAPSDEWDTLHCGIYPAYIDWEDFMANQARLADNASDFARRARGAPQTGTALLAGLVVCGRCGYQMRLAYKPLPRYVCTALAAAYGAATCLRVDGSSLDAVVVEAFFAALAPAKLDLLEEVLAAQRADHAQLGQHYADEIARADYEARLAERQYRAVDPDNRLVAAELERRWELALGAVEEAHEAAARFAAQPPAPALDSALKEQLGNLGRQLPALWHSGRLTPTHQKELLRSLIRRVIVTRPVPDTVDAKIVWVSGTVTPLQVHPAILRGTDIANYKRFVERVLALGSEGHSDRTIAERLTAEGFRSARRARVPGSLIGDIRRARGQISLIERFKNQAMIDDQWTVAGLAQEIDFHRNWLYTRIRDRTLPATRHPVTGHYLVPDDPEVLAQLRAQRE